MSDTLQGKDYRALRRLTDGENHILADVGETCQFVPKESLAALLASGDIALAEERRADRPPAATKAGR